MAEVSTDQLKAAVESQHGGKATFVESVSVKEEFQGQVAFQGSVAVFDLDGTPNATRAYAWAQDRSDGRKRYVAVLHLGGIRSPQDAVRAAIVAEARTKNHD